MIAIGIEYLNGVAVATHPADYREAEWPPHPARLFMALAASFFETRDNSMETAYREREALEWLEALPSPEIVAPRGSSRGVVKHFVPVNDLKTKDVIPRRRQERFFPATVLGDESSVWFVWAEAAPTTPIRAALERLTQRLVRVGHSSSFVRACLADVPGKAQDRWTPSDGGSLRLRVSHPGLLSNLEELHALGERPSTGKWQGYELWRGTVSAPDPVPSVFDPRIVILRLREGPNLGLTFTLRLTDALRSAVMSNAPATLPEFLSGHGSDGGPSRRPHAAFLPLAFVDGEYADGHLMGLGIALPIRLSAEERMICLRALASRLSSSEQPLIRLNLGRLGVWEMKVDSDEDPPRNLRPSLYTRRCTTWASVTPVVLDRFAEEEREQEEIIATGCERIGLPSPIEVHVSRFSQFRSVPPAWEFPPLTTGKRQDRRYHVHVALRFAQPVCGPVLIGAGRYRGYGLCKPVGDSGRV